MSDCSPFSPMKLKGNTIIVDKKLPQNEMQFTARSRFVLPIPGRRQGHTRELAIANVNDGMPSTISCKIDKSFAKHMVHCIGFNKENMNDASEIMHDEFVCGQETKK